MRDTYSLSPAAAAEILGVHVDTVKRWAKAEKLPAIRTPGGWWRFSESELRAWLVANHNGGEAA